MINDGAVSIIAHFADSNHERAQRMQAQRTDPFLRFFLSSIFGEKRGCGPETRLGQGSGGSGGPFLD